ncbi:Pentatricopeptide repeat-containing protein, partial [Drosera capensis]
MEPTKQNPNTPKRLLSLIKQSPNTRLLRQIHARILTTTTTTSALSSLFYHLLSASVSIDPGGAIYAAAVYAQIPKPNLFIINTVIRSFAGTIPALSIFKIVLARGSPRPNSHTIANTLRACGVGATIGEGKQMHCQGMRNGLCGCLFVGTGLVDLYGKCGWVGDARKVFDEMSERNVVAWSAMIAGCVRNGMVEEGFGAFREMREAGVVPDEITMVSVVSGCAVAGDLGMARRVHGCVRGLGIRGDAELDTAIVNMYAKCGSIQMAREVFDGMKVKDTKAWSAMIVGLAIHGLAEEALELFSKMLASKVRPNNVTFLGVLSACAHGGLGSEGRRYWTFMLDSGITPTMELYGCMVDLLCRANLIEEAFAFVEFMPTSPNPVILRTLLMGCKKSRKLSNKGEAIAERLLELQPSNVGNYILVCNVYASVSQWEKVSDVRRKMKEKNFEVQVAGYSSIEVNGHVHRFTMGDWSNPEAEAIREVLHEMNEKVLATGHKPDLSSVLHDIGDEEKGKDLVEHSERLAIAYGLMKIKAPGTIRIVKNLRVCDDCHEVTKTISK